MAPPQPKAVPQILQELWELLKAYARQETVDPLKGLGRFLGFGVAGALLVGLGGLFLALSLLRLLQRFSVFTGTWSWAPYFIVLLALVLAIALIIGVISQGRARSDKRKAAAANDAGARPPATPAPPATSVATPSNPSTASTGGQP
ncbi:MAG: hypothetical protein U0Q07_02795 [Acidimicrobiales bacterium]